MRSETLPGLNPLSQPKESEMSFHVIKTPTVRENFVREIEHQILSGQLKIGDKLPPAKELCSLMGVSLTVVNAGISELASKGFIETIPRHGTYVADYKKKGNIDTLVSIMRYNGGRLTDSAIRSLCEVRIALDPFVAKLVIERASTEEIEQLAPCLAAMRQEKDLLRQCELITDFYYQLSDLSGNTFLALLYNSTFEPQKGIYTLYCEKNGTDSVITHAEQIYAGLLARDLEAVQNHMMASVRSAIEGEMAIV